MYDWISRKGIPGNVTFGDYHMTGIGLTGESSLYFMFDDDENFGLSVGAIYSIRNMTFGYFEPEEVMAPVVPDHTLKSFYWNVCLLIPAEIFASRSYSTTTIRVVD